VKLFHVCTAGHRFKLGLLFHQLAMHRLDFILQLRPIIKCCVKICSVFSQTNANKKIKPVVRGWQRDLLLLVLALFSVDSKLLSM
jgi:hypothetical protein